MKPSQLIKEIQVCILGNTVPYITGPPGVGKTDVARQAVASLAEIEGFNREFTPYSAPLFDPTTLQGLGYLFNQDTKMPILGHPAYKQPPTITTRFAPFNFWPTDPNAVIFLDEFPSATPMQQAMYYQMLWGHRLGEKRFPETQRFMLAGNRLEDRAFVNKMSTANNARLVHLPFDVDFDDWLAWAIAKPIDSRVVFYHKYRKFQFLHRFDPERDDKAFPCPRTWEIFSRDLQAADLIFKDQDRPSRYEKAKGIVGEAAGADVCGFLDILDKIINPDIVLMKPDTVQIPEDPMVLMSLCGAVANRATKKTMPAVCTFAGRIPDEYSGLLIHIAINRDKQLMATNAFQQWAESHPKVVC